jgi:hypothetical protein
MYPDKPVEGSDDSFAEVCAAASQEIKRPSRKTTPATVK